MGEFSGWNCPGGEMSYTRVGLLLIELSTNQSIRFNYDVIINCTNTNYLRAIVSILNHNGFVFVVRSKSD